MLPEFLHKEQELQYTKGKKIFFIDNTLRNILNIILKFFNLSYFSSKNGLLQKLNNKTKTLFLLSYIFFINYIHNIVFQLFISILILTLCLCSRINPLKVFKKSFLASFLFGFLIFFPASLNIFVKGKPLINIYNFNKEIEWWIYKIPENIYITTEGATHVMRLTLRIFNSVSLVILILYTTTFEKLIKALSSFGIPNIFTLTVSLTNKFINILALNIINTYKALKMRWWNRDSVEHAREIVSHRIGYLYRKSLTRYEETILAMTARGFNEKLNFYYFEKLKKIDIIFLVVIISFLIITIIYE